MAIPVPDYVAFDVETTGFSPDDDRIIEVAFVRFENGVPVERFSSLVRPDREVGLKILRLTGISREELADSPDIGSIVGQIEQFRGGLPLVGHNPEFDVSFLSRVIPGFPGVPVYDTLELARIVYPGLKSFKLGDLASELGIPLCDAHRACDDAEATGLIFAAIQERVLAISKAVREKIIRIMGADWVSRSVFQVQESPGPQLLLFIEPPSAGSLPGDVKPLPAETCLDRVEEACLDWVADLLQGQRGHTFVDFPLEGLTPAKVAKSLSAHPGPVVLAADLAADMDAGSAASQGMSFLSVPRDYLCLLKADMVEDLTRGGHLDHLDVESKRFLSTITVWRSITQNGMFREIQVVGKGHTLSRELSCLGFPDCQEFCPYLERCFYRKALNAALASRLIVVPKEHCLDVPGELNASGCVLLGFDELGTIWERRQPRLDLERLRSVLEGLGCTGLAEQVERLIFKGLDALGSNHDMVVPEDLVAALASLHREIRLVLPELSQALKHSLGTCSQLQAAPPVLGADLRRLEYWADQMEGILAQDNTSVCLLERGYGDARGVISRKHVWPAIHGKISLVERFGNVVLVSPNASFVSRFEGLRRLYGFEPGDRVHHVDHPVTHAQAGTGPLLVSIDKGHRLSYSEHLELTGDFIKQLALATSENILCLCPSYSYIRSLAGQISEFLESNQIAVFAQGVDGGARVLEHLGEPGTLVLARFGVDILGNTQVLPRILVIPRIPFLPPNTMADIRQREISSLGKSGFVEISVMPVVLALRAYMEDLSRAVGNIAVFLLDPKLLPGQSGWGSEFMAQFHDVASMVCPQQIGIAQALRWIRSGNSKR